MLTGLEQYSLERAGYFIRRGFLDDASLAPALAAAEALRSRLRDLELSDSLSPAVVRVAELAADILGPRPRLARVSVGFDHDAAPIWTRGFDISYREPLGEQTAQLARAMEHIQARIALAPDESFVLQPGTHSAPPAPEDLAALRLNAAADVPGQVRVRLAPGDALFWNTNVLHKADRQSREGTTIRVTFVARNFPPGATIPLQKSEEMGVAETIRSAMGANE